MIVYAASKIIPKYATNPYTGEKTIKLYSNYKVPVKYFADRDDCIEFILSSEEKLVLEKIKI